MVRALCAATILTFISTASLAAATQDAGIKQPPPGFELLFNGSNLDGFRGLVADPEKRAVMSQDELTAQQEKSDALIAKHWRAERGEIINDGKGPHLCTIKEYGDYELWLDWKISAGADSGIYLRGSPQVQIWDPVNGIDQAKVGSGGLYNNQKNPSKPPVVADNPTGEWNTFYIKQLGERVTVKLNGKLVADNVVMENYWNRKRPIYPKGQIELQTHGGEIRFRNLFIREIDATEANSELSRMAEPGFRELFNGHDLTGFQGAVNGYEAVDGVLRCKKGNGGLLVTEEEFSDFVMRFEFRLPPGGNNGIAIRCPPVGDPAYTGMELQVLENTAPKFANLKKYQYHGSVYGVHPAHRGYQRPVGEWNSQEIICNGSHIKVILNGSTITDVDLATIDKTMDGNQHPGLHRSSGHVGFAGHGDQVEFRNVRLKPLTPAEG